MLFYERAVALNRERHHKLHIEPLPDHFSFAAKTNTLLLSSTEVADASRDHPIVFIGQEGGPFSLAALVGLRDSENLLVDGAGKWETNAYVPAVARRYPFVLAESEDKSVLTVCIDEAYRGLNEERGERLFDEGGTESPYLARVLQFLKAFHADMQATQGFSARLGELGLLTPKVITINRENAGSPSRQVLNGVWVVDEEKLRQLDDAASLEIFRKGYMGWIYAHLLSVRNVARLVARLDRVRPESAPETPPETPPEPVKPASRKRSVGARATGWNGSERRKNPR